MRLIEPDEHKDFLATLQRNGLAEGDFDVLETDTMPRTCPRKNSFFCLPTGCVWPIPDDHSKLHRTP
jgi:hypothetical protein